MSIIYTILVLIAGSAMLLGLGWLWRKPAVMAIFSPHIAIILRGASRLIVIGLTCIIALRMLGVDSQAVWASVSAMILVVAVGFFAVWSVLSNLFCAALLLFYAPFRIGDEIELIEPGKDYWLRGTVIDVNMFFVSILERHQDGSESVGRIPNNLILQKAIRRWPGEAKGQQTVSLAQTLARFDRQGYESRERPSQPANTSPNAAAAPKQATADPAQAEAKNDIKNDTKNDTVSDAKKLSASAVKQSKDKKPASK